MKQTLSALQRETAELSHKIGATTIKPVVFRALNAEGEEAAHYSLHGDRIEEIPKEAIVISVPEKAIKPLLAGKRHAVLYGGRAGGKSHTIALFLLSLAYTYGVKILCIREVQLSIRDSVHALLKSKIDSIPDFQEFFTVYESEIRGKNGSLFTFRGMRRESSHSIKSYEGYDFAWIEEAAALSRRSVDLLIPTIRKAGSRILWSLNPDEETDPAYVDFVLEDRDDTERAEILYTDNPFNSQRVYETAERDRMKDPAKYRHIWLGGLREKGRGQIFPDYTVIPDIPLSDLPFRTVRDRQRYGPYIQSRFEREYGKGSVFCGLDWGHSGPNHPTHVVFGWVSPRNSKIVIIAEYRGEDKTLDDLAREIPEFVPILRDRYIPIWADSSRPESINHLRSRGLNVKSAPKWPNSVLDGIEKLRATEIQICTSCTETIRDFSRYSWKLDANEEPLGAPEKSHDHAPDATRYGVHRYIKHGAGEYQKLKDPYM
jgi:phage terminase large subunit